MGRDSESPERRSSHRRREERNASPGRERQKRAAERDRWEDRRYDRKERPSAYERPSDRERAPSRRDHRHDVEPRYASRLEKDKYVDKGAPEVELPVRRGRGNFRGGPDQETHRSKPAEAKLRGERGQRPDVPRADWTGARLEANGTGAPSARTEKPAGKAGGVYIPPFKLAQMLSEQNDTTSEAYQKLSWDALRKSINGLVNRVNASNVPIIVGQLLKENLVRGQGLFCRSLLKSAMASPTFAPVFAALVAIINTKLPEIGELLANRLVLQFKRSFARNDKMVMKGSLKLLAHLVNQQVVGSFLALQIAVLLLEKPTDDSVEVALELAEDIGAHLKEFERRSLDFIFERFRRVATEGTVDQRLTMLIENFFTRMVQSKGIENMDNPSIPPGLDFVEVEEQITHNVDLEQPAQAKPGLDVFRFDPDFQEHEAEYKRISREMLGEESSDEDDRGGSDGGEDDDEDEDDDDDEDEPAQQPGGAGMKIEDATQTNLINLRRTIYLTIMSAAGFEEAGHKLMKIELKDGQEIELVSMLIECCSQERTFLKYYGLLAQRFCLLHSKWAELFEDCFQKQYALIHRLETNKLRNVAKLFAMLLYTDAITWGVLSDIRLTEDDTTSSSRIFIKILFQELAENMGLMELNTRLQDPRCAPWLTGVFPADTQRNTRFAINFFTSIGLGGLTDTMRNQLKEMQRQLLLARNAAALKAEEESSSEDESDSSSSDDSSDDSSSSSSTDSSDSDSDSDSDSSSSESEDDARQKGKKAGKELLASKARTMDMEGDRVQKELVGRADTATDRKRKRDDDDQVDRKGRQPRTPPRSDSGMRPSPPVEYENDRSRVGGPSGRLRDAPRPDRNERARQAPGDSRRGLETSGGNDPESFGGRTERSALDRDGRRIASRDDRYKAERERDGRYAEREDKRRERPREDREKAKKRARSPDILDRWDGGAPDHTELVA